MNGKGSTQRPRQVAHDDYAANWARTFARKHTTSDDAPADSTPLERYMYGTRWTDVELASIRATARAGLLPGTINVIRGAE